MGRDNLSSDSEVELVDPQPRIRSTGIKRRKILDPSNIANVPIYSSRVSRNLTLYQENPEQVDRELQKQVAALDSEDELEGDGEPAWRSGRKRKARTGGQYVTLSDSEEEADRETSFSTSRRDRSPSPPSSPTLPDQQTGRAYIAIREANRNLRDLEAFRTSPLKGRGLSESDDVVLVGVIPSIPASPREITVKVRCRDHIYRVPMRMTDPLQKVVDHIASRLQVSARRVLLLQNEAEVPLSETPESQNLTIADILDCFIMSEHPGQHDVKCADKICLRVRGVEKNSSQVIPIGKVSASVRGEGGRGNGFCVIGPVTPVRTGGESIGSGGFEKLSFKSVVPGICYSIYKPPEPLD
ncbi:NFATC2-interacting protein [Heptranchias perlo]|uniref:NFATC2-interacting protein n=1 Tax=Heptranchias perlo TaxID=212740 RepID=UPI00355A11B7